MSLAGITSAISCFGFASCSYFFPVKKLLDCFSQVVQVPLKSTTAIIIHCCMASFLLYGFPCSVATSTIRLVMQQQTAKHIVGHVLSCYSSLTLLQTVEIFNVSYAVIVIMILVVYLGYVIRCRISLLSWEPP